MKEVEVVLLEDKQEYAIIDTIPIEDTKYIYLGLVKEMEKEKIETPEIVIRKYDKKEKYILGLDTEEEYTKALEAFLTKWKSLENS